MDAAEYKHVVLGLIFLKYISDALEAKYTELEAQRKDGADPEDPDEYRAANIFWVPKEARWSRLKASAPQPTIGKLVDDAMSAIERDNPTLKGVLPKDYARPGLDKQRLGANPIRQCKRAVAAMHDVQTVEREIRERRAHRGGPTGRRSSRLGQARAGGSRPH